MSRVLKQHGPCRILQAAYSGEGFRPGLECTCGFIAGGETWSEAGEEFDQHLDDDRGEDQDVSQS